MALDQSHKSAGKRIKILFVIDKLVPAGTQKNLLEIITRLDRARFDPHLAVFQLGPEARWFIEKAGVIPVVLPVKRAYDWTGWRAFIGLCALMRREKFAWVQLHFLQAEMLAIPAARFFGKPARLVTTRRDEGFWRTGRQLALNRFYARQADVVLSNSKAVQKTVLEKEGIPEGKTAVIYNGVDTSVFKPDDAARVKVRREFLVEDHEVLVVTVSNMRYEIKGYRYLIEAAQKVCLQNPRVKFLFAGDGDLRPAFEAQALQLGVRDRIFFAGIRQDIPALLNAADIVCQPSLSEGFSNTLLEAMACRKAVVVTAVGGNTEVVEDDVSGVLVPAADSGALALEIAMLAAGGEVRARLAEAAGARIAREFSMEAMVMNYEQFYSRLDLSRRS